MESSSWIHGYAANSDGGGGGSSGYLCGYDASCIPSVLKSMEEEHELLLSSEIHQHLNQARIMSPYLLTLFMHIPKHQIMQFYN